MTCVAALARNGGVWMACDDETSYGGTRVHGARKVRHVKIGGEQDALLAADGDGGILGTVQREVVPDAVPPPPLDHGAEAMQEWADGFANLVTVALASATPPIVDADDANTIDGALLLALVRHPRDRAGAHPRSAEPVGQLWYLFTHQATLIPERDGTAVAALGSGTDVALGSMRALLAATDLSSAAIVEGAVRLAAEYAPGVSGGPFVYAL